MIGNKLKELRSKKNLTILQVSELININANTYAKYERCERDVSTETLSKLADFYGVTTDYLLGRETGEPTAVDKLEREFNMSALEKKILEGYLELSDDMRSNFMDFLQKSVREVQNDE